PICKVPTGTFQTKKFSFVDEKGALQTRKVSDLFGSSSIIDYAYDNVTKCGRKPPPAPTGPSGATVAPPTAPAQKVGTTADVSIGDPVTRVTVKLPKTGP